MKSRSSNLFLCLLIPFLLFGMPSFASASIAITKNDLYENVIRSEAEYGLYQDWSVVQKINMVGWMQEAGIAVDAGQINILNDNTTSATQKEIIADDIIESYYGPGRGGAITILDIIGKDAGDYDTWSIEEKAWLTQTQQADGVFNNPDLNTLYVVNLLPDSTMGDITQKEVLKIARDAYQKAFGFTPDELDSMELNLFFILSPDMEYRLPGDPNNYCGTLRLWMVRYQNAAGEYSVQIRNDGVILSLSTPEGNFFADELLEKTSD
jgi:hypothetical protein